MNIDIFYTSIIFSTDECDADQFECKAGVCIFESNNNCNGVCILSSWVNDGAEDCSDGSDEGATPDKGELTPSFKKWFFDKNYLYNLCHTSVDCQWSDWTPSGSCSKSCGGGSQKFTRDKTVSESNGGSCSGSNEKTDSCNTQDCTSGPGKLEWI